jgi:hypothetical protein
MPAAVIKHIIGVACCVAKSVANTAIEVEIVMKIRPMSVIEFGEMLFGTMLIAELYSLFMNALSIIELYTPTLLKHFIRSMVECEIASIELVSLLGKPIL